MLGDIIKCYNNAEQAARHQTVHLLIGFIGLPVRQLNASANSGKFIMDALVLRQSEKKNVLNCQYNRK